MRLNKDKNVIIQYVDDYIIDYNLVKCPTCNAVLLDELEPTASIYFNFCPFCSQKLSWENYKKRKETK